LQKEDKQTNMGCLKTPMEKNMRRGRRTLEQHPKVAILNHLY
jgi:hypothetical protein